MRTILKFCLLVAICLVFPENNIIAQEKTVNASAKSSQELQFPDIESWIKDNISYNPIREGGYSINYRYSKGGIVTVYVYNAGEKKIPNDLSSKVVKNQMAMALSNVQETKKLKIYDDVSDEKSDSIMLGGEKGKVKTLHSSFTFTKGEFIHTSHIYIFPYKNNFIKIRASYPGKLAPESLEKLLATLDDFFVQ